MERLFINLTNGIEVFKNMKVDIPFSFLRIQSTHCEQKQWGKILRELDYTFLMSIVMGETIYIADFSAHKGEPRALYQGLPWIKYALNRRLFGEETISYVKDYNVTEYFKEEYNKLKSEDFYKIDYAKKFLIGEKLRIFKITGGTKLDGNYNAYKRILSLFREEVSGETEI